MALGTRGWFHCGDAFASLRWAEGQTQQTIKVTMRKLYYVTPSMCGGDLPEDFDLDDFCEVLQGKLDEDVEVIAINEEELPSDNLDPDLVSDAIFTEALGEYYHR